MLESLSVLDLASLVLLVLIVLIVLLGSRDGRVDRQGKTEAGAERTLTGSISLDPDVSLDAVTPTDTNDPLMLAYSSGSLYKGPDQTALSMALLDDAAPYDKITGHIPADSTLFGPSGALAAILKVHG